MAKLIMFNGPIIYIDSLNIGNVTETNVYVVLNMNNFMPTQQHNVSFIQNK